MLEDLVPTGTPGDTESVEAVLALAARAEAHDGVAPLSEEFLLALRSGGDHLALGPGAGHLVSRAQDGSVDGVAVRAGDGVEIVVDPAHRRRGVGRALLDAARAAVPTSRFWAHGDLPGARALAVATGLGAARELLKLGRSVTAEDAASPEAPGVLTLSDYGDNRDAGLDDWLQLNALAFADHPEQGRWTTGDLADRVAEPWFDADLLLLLPRDGARGEPLEASLWLKPQGEVCEIYVVAVHPDSAGRGLGRAVLVHALGVAARRGFADVELYVDGGNTAARRLYERAGFDVRTRDVQYAS
ncbi:mycothiol synthase [Serinibacter arcticus]|uniref:Mycothiol acetyltransferase n=1 Tax=Serinibacter arcticus TaxID=1655435 RepID=A0A2U2A050_9MICO|nr:mycothiol synthase [Serinibacter arcticus]PWD52596.1 mycothiol synthase [Serinibacter arcticus]